MINNNNIDILFNYPGIYNTKISPMALNPSIPPFYLLDNVILPTKITYPNVNNDPNLRKKMVKYYWDKIKTWLNESNLYKNLYTKMYVVADKIKFGMDEKPESTKNNIIKYEYIITEIINKKDLYNILDKFCKYNDVNYWDLQDINIKKKLKNFIYNKINKVLLKQKN